MELEDHLAIETPEGVELDLTLAGIGSRLLEAFSAATASRAAP